MNMGMWSTKTTEGDALAMCKTIIHLAGLLLEILPEANCLQHFSKSSLTLLFCNLRGKVLKSLLAHNMGRKMSMVNFHTVHSSTLTF